MARRYTRWLYRASYSNGRLLVGRAYNNSPKCDIIRIRWEKDGQEPPVDVGVRVDEAIDMAAGLNYLAALQMCAQKERQQRGARKAARTRRRHVRD